MNQSSGLIAMPSVLGKGEWDQGIDYVTKAICFFVVIIPLDGFYYFSERVGYSVPTIVGYVTFLVCIPRIFSILKIQPISFWLWVAIYAVGSFIAIVSSIYLSATPTRELASIWQMIALAAIVCYASTSKNGSRTVLNCLVMGIAFTALVYVICYSSGFQVANGVEEGRVFKVAGYQTNEIGDVVVIGVLLVLGNFRRWTSRVKSLLLYGGVPLAGYVLWLGNSRTAIVALGFGIAIFFLLDKVKSLKRSWMLVIPLLFVLYALAPGPAKVVLRSDILARETARWTGGLEKEGIDIDYVTADRSEIIPQGLALALENPIGYGIGNGQYLLGGRLFFGRFDRVDTHNDYLRVLLDCGVIGLALYVVGLFMVFSLTIRVYRQSKVLWPLLVLSGLSIMSVGHNICYYKTTWIPLGLIFGLTVLESRTVTEAANEERTRVAFYKMLFRSAQELPSTGVHQ